MKIKSLHIVEFGALSNFDITFTDGITTVCENNGFGKSTLAAFIKAMFYGLESYSTRTKAFLDRMHYCPFGSKDFGGNITVEYEKKEYRIERTFAAKSETGDTLTVYCNGNLTDELGTVPGVKLFGINKESFENLLCVDSFNTRVSADSDINKKLNNYVDNVSEDFDITAVIEKIDKITKQCGNSIKTLNVRIKEHEAAVANLKNLKDSLSGKYDLLTAAAAEQQQAENAYKSASTRMALLEKWNNYDYLLEQFARTQSAFKDIEMRYPKSLPTKEETDAAAVYLKTISDNSLLLSGNETAKQDESQLSALKERYKNGLPTQDELDDIHAKILDLENEQRQLAKLSSAQSADISELDKHFHGESVSVEFISSLENGCERYNALSTELLDIPQYTIVRRSSQPIKVPVRKTPYIAVLAVAVALIIAGVILISPVFIAGLLCLIAGGAVILGDMFAYLNKSMNNYVTPEEEPQEIPNPEHEQKKSELETLRNKLLMSLANYRYNGDDPIKLTYELKRDADEYKRLLAENTQKESAVAALAEDSKQLDGELSEFFARFGISGSDYSRSLDTVKTDITNYTALEKRLADSAEMTADRKTRIETAKQQVKAFAQKYALPDDFGLEKLRADMKEYERLAKELRERKQSAEQFRLANKLDERPANEQADVETLKDTLNEKLTACAMLRSQISDIEEQLSELDSREAALDQCRQQSKELSEKRSLFEDLRREITSADQTLKDRYIKPIRDRFCEYAKIIENTIGQKVSMDKDYRISFDIKGQLRRYEHLSSGNLAVCALCFRLALIDNMFANDKPFIIMDDPFLTLDSEHFNKTKTLMQKLSADKQMIYFCCHESRII